MSDKDHEVIYLQPECCADPYEGRLWCEDPDPVDCEDGKTWTKYIRADRIEQLEAENVRLKGIEKAARAIYVYDPDPEVLSAERFGVVVKALDWIELELVLQQEGW